MYVYHVKRVKKTCQKDVNIISKSGQDENLRGVPNSYYLINPLFYVSPPFFGWIKTGISQGLLLHIFSL